MRLLDDEFDVLFRGFRAEGGPELDLDDEARRRNEDQRVRAASGDQRTVEVSLIDCLVNSGFVRVLDRLQGQLLAHRTHKRGRADHTERQVMRLEQVSRADKAGRKPAHHDQHDDQPHDPLPHDPLKQRGVRLGTRCLRWGHALRDAHGCSSLWIAAVAVLARQPDRRAPDAPAGRVARLR